MTESELRTAIRKRLKKANTGRAYNTGYHIENVYANGGYCRWNLMFRRNDGSVFHCAVLGDTTGQPEAILAKLESYLSE